MKLQGDYETISGLNAEILAISVDDLSGASYVVENLGLDFPILYNHEKDVVQAYGVYNSSTGYANPSVFIVDTEGVVQWRFIGSTYNRASNSDIIAQLEKLS